MTVVKVTTATWPQAGVAHLPGDNKACFQCFGGTTVRPVSPVAARAGGPITLASDKPAHRKAARPELQRRQDCPPVLVGKGVVVEVHLPRKFRPGLEISAWPNLKHARAIALFRELQGRIETWSASQPFTTDKVLSEDGLTASVILRVRQPPPLDEWSLLLGDALHNVRSSLDSLVWELAHYDGRKPDRPKDLYFPIVTEEARWPRAAGMIGSCPAEAIERIRLLQPFLIPDLGPSGLEVLANLNNQDKHRVPIRATMTVQQLTVDNATFEFANEDDIPDPPFRIKVEDVIPMEDGTIVTEFVSTARMVRIDVPIAMGAQFAIRYNDQPAEMVHTINTVAQYARIIIDTVAHGHPAEHTSQDANGWTTFDMGEPT